VSAQGLTYPQNAALPERLCRQAISTARDRGDWCQLIDFVDFFEDASNLSDSGRVAMIQAFAMAASSFPTKLSTESVGSSKSFMDHELTAGCSQIIKLCSTT